MAMEKRAVLTLILLISALLLSQLGCEPVTTEPEAKVRSTDQTTAVAVATPSAVIHDLAITAIDFDPALKPGSSLATGNITLLIAVENKGNQEEKDVVVETTLLGLPNFDVLVTSQGIVDQIVPGESQIVRLSNFSSIPLRSGYSLKVEARPVSGEELLENNLRTYRLEVTVSSR